MFFSFRISSTRFSHSFMGQALFPVLRNRYYIVRRIDDIVILVSTPGRPSKMHDTYAVTTTMTMTTMTMTMTMTMMTIMMMTTITMTIMMKVNDDGDGDDDNDNDDDNDDDDDDNDAIMMCE